MAERVKIGQERGTTNLDLELVVGRVSDSECQGGRVSGGLAQVQVSWTQDIKLSGFCTEFSQSLPACPEPTVHARVSTTHVGVATKAGARGTVRLGRGRELGSVR